MTAFISFTSKPLIYYDDDASAILDGDYYRIAESFRYYVGENYANQWVYVGAGTLTDLASTPSIVWWLLPPSGKYGAAAIVHDKLCNTLKVTIDGKQVDITRKRCDEILGEAMEVLGVPKWKRLLISGAVATHRVVMRVDKPVISAKQIELEKTWVRQANESFEF